MKDPREVTAGTVSWTMVTGTGSQEQYAPRTSTVPGTYAQDIAGYAAMRQSPLLPQVLWHSMSEGSGTRSQWHVRDTQHDARFALCSGDHIRHNL